MVNWPMLLCQLRRHYKPLSTVATEVGSNWQHLNRIARFEVAEPRFNLGVRLLDLAHDHIPPAEFRQLKTGGLVRRVQTR